jgi:hypothetical protein
MTIDASMRARVAERLGREPRGLRAVPISDESGAPRVIRVASVIEGKPFPTLFWLVDPALNYRIDREEAGGLIARLQARVGDDAALRASMAADHRRHVVLRESYLTAEERAWLQAKDLWPALAERGIGGIADFSRIRCLHTWYAAHLVCANSIGRLLDEHWSAALS